MKKFLVFLMIITTLSLCLISCGETKAPETGVAGTKLDYAALSEYTVVFTDGDDVSFNAAMTVKRALDEKTGASLRVAAMPEALGAKQIVVGNNATAKALGVDVSVKYFDYDVSVTDATVFVCAESDDAASAAVEYLLAGLKDDGLEISDYHYAYSYSFEYVKINGIDISEYTVCAEKANAADAEIVKNNILEKCGALLNITEQKQGRAIVLKVDDSVNFNTCVVEAVGEDIVVSASGANATYLGALALCDMIDDYASEGKIDMTIDAKTEIQMDEYTKNLSAYKFFDENGNLDVNGDGNINIAFIGGSLTQNRTAWTDPVANWFKKTFPNKTVKYHNAGIGATNSEVAAARLKKDVFDHMIPDVIFVEFAVNDGGFATRDDAALIKNCAYMESIVKQCAALENKPVVIFLYYPLGQRKGTTTYDNWYNGVHLKTKLGENYGISGINVWTYFENLYLEQTKSNPSLTYDAFLLQYYDGKDMTHPTNTGFAIFGDAIVEALDASAETFLMNRISAPTYLTKFEDITDLSYVLTPLDDPRFTIEGAFKYYKSANSYEQGDPRAVTAGKVSNGQLTHGVIQFENGAGSISFETDADVVKLYGMYSSKGMNLDVMCDGEKIGQINTNSNNDYLFIKGVDIPENGNDTHVIKITPAAENGDNYVFRIGYVVECYKK